VEVGAEAAASPREASGPAGSEPAASEPIASLPAEPQERAGRGRWTEPGAYPVAPGVHRIPLPLPDDGLRAVNVYAVEQPDGVALVDSGWAMPDSLTALEGGLAALGHELGDVRQILVTHIHRDHYTQAVDLRRRLGSRVYLGAGERPGLEMLHRVRSNAPVSSLRTLRRAGAAPLADRIERYALGTEWDAATWESPDGWLEAGEHPVGERTLRVVPTPGHTKGHVVFLDETAGLLFAGDHVLPHITPSIGFELADPGLPLGEFLDSLRLVRSFPDAVLLPAHGPAGGGTHARVAELLAHHDHRLDQAMIAIGSRTLDALEVAGLLTWTRREHRLGDLDVFNRMLAVCETAAHLDLLVARGRLAETTDGAGVARYAATAPAA
jgi:glyoxylase-like metal-dependent hydrolase (beta-lactamase superfamily II)